MTTLTNSTTRNSTMNITTNVYAAERDYASTIGTDSTITLDDCNVITNQLFDRLPTVLNAPAIVISDNSNYSGYSIDNHVIYLSHIDTNVDTLIHELAHCLIEAVASVNDHGMEFVGFSLLLKSMLIDTYNIDEAMTVCDIYNVDYDIDWANRLVQFLDLQL